MYMRKIKWFLIIVILTFVSLAYAQSGGPYILEWSTIDGGSGQSSGDDYILTGTIGQPDAGNLAGGDYELLGGFLAGGPMCIVEFEDYARFAQYWLQTGSDLPADLYKDEFDIVKWKELDEFVYWWLYECPYNWPLR
jgi:hypothetical protein